MIAATPAANGTALTPVEKSERTRLVKRVKSGLATFVQVGNDLTRLRDGKLYRSTHGTFEEFVRDEFGISKDSAYDYINGAKVVDDSSTFNYPPPKNLEQARELAGVPMELRPKVMEELAANPAEASARRLNELATKAFLSLPPKEQVEMVEQHQERVHRMVKKSRAKTAIEKIDGLLKKIRKLAEDLPNTTDVGDALDTLYAVVHLGE